MSITAIGRRLLFASAAVAAAFASAAHAQSYPSRPIELVVHTAPGGGTDLIARLVADIMVKEKLVNQPVNVMNRVGGGGAIAYTYIKSKKGDPHVVMSVATLAMLNQVVRPELGLGLENYTPLAFLAQDPQALMVGADTPFKTFKDFIETAKREPNSLVGSVASAGGTARMFIWMLERDTGARFKVVANKSGSDAILQVLGGHTHFSPENIAEGYAQVQAKKLRVLAVTSSKRLPIVPDTPTMNELGININIGTGRGFAMPAGVPKEAAAYMEGVLRRVYASPAWKDHAEKNFYENLWKSSTEYGKYLAERSNEVREFQKGIGLLQ
jgi:putative tricarboxylic transport membrane protein